VNIDPPSSAVDNSLTTTFANWPTNRLFASLSLWALGAVGNNTATRRRGFACPHSPWPHSVTLFTETGIFVYQFLNAFVNVGGWSGVYKLV
jgi:hypothetical protein